MANPFLQAVGIKEPTSNPSVNQNPFLQAVSPSISKPSPIELTSPYKLSGETQITQAPEKVWPLGFIGKAAKAAYETAESTLENAATKLGSFISSLDSTGKATPLERVTKLGEATLGIANIAFTPITAGLEAGKEVPVIKYPAEAISWGFQKLGEGGAYVASKGVDTLPISEESKETIRPLAEELGTFAAQFAGAKTAHIAVKKSVGMMKTKIAERKTQGIEITPDEGIKIVNEVKEELPAQIKPKPEISAQPINPFMEAVKPKETAPITTQSKIGKSIEAKAVEDKLTKGFSEVAGYDKITIKDQAQRATDLINSDVETARKVIRGEEPLPEGLRGTSLITAMEDYIKKNPDGDLAYELANSPLVSETSFAAQELRLAAERIPDSATAKLMEVKKAREEKASKATKKKKQDITKDIKKETDKVNLTEKEGLSWEKFLSAIEC